MTSVQSWDKNDENHCPYNINIDKTLVVAELLSSMKEKGKGTVVVFAS